MKTYSVNNIDLSSFKAFIFDLDGTLLDSEKYHLRAFARAMLELADYEITAEDAREFNGNTTFALAEILSRRHRLGIDARSVAKRKFEILYEDYRSEPQPGALEFLAAWHGVVPFAIASNSPQEFVRKALSQVSAFDRFEVITTVDDVRQRKPDPEMFLLSVARLGLPASECLIFEDSDLGLTAAMAAGCPVILLDNPGTTLPDVIPPGVLVVHWDDLPRPGTPKPAALHTQPQRSVCP